MLEKEKLKTCCFIGHEEIRQKDKPEIYNLTMDFIIKLYNKGYRYFLADQITGYDDVAITVLINAKQHYSDMELILLLPWETRERYEGSEAIEKASLTVYTTHSYAQGEKQKRMRFLIHSSSACIAYQYKKSDVAAYGVKYARKYGRRIFNVAEELNEKADIPPTV